MAPTRAEGALDPATAETHSGVVVFLGDRAYKLKKAVDLGFLDFRTREAREAACHREVALNRRLAPDVYLGVSDVLDPDGEPCDHMVVMRRMPTDRRLSEIVRADTGGDEEVRAVARVVAEFHQRARRGVDVDEVASVAALRRRWEDNAAAMRPFGGTVFDEDDLARVDRLAHRYLAGRAALIESRIAAGRAVDGHGDLLADDVFCLDDGPRLLDCLDFDDHLRFEDGLADICFLAMDLEHLGRADLAEVLLDEHRARTDDDWPGSLAHHHIAHRAQVRAKVTAIRAAQGAAGADAVARDLLALCLRHLGAARVRLVLVGGLPGTGKSTVAAGVGEALGVEVIRTDVVRKEMAGIDGTSSARDGYDQGLYSPAARAATYDEVLRRAEVSLRDGRTVVLDASWSDDAARARAAEVAAATASDLVELRCEVAAEVAAQRITARAARGTDASDADPEVAARMATDAAPWPSSTPIDTSGEVAASVEAALRAVVDAPGG